MPSSDVHTGAMEGVNIPRILFPLVTAPFTSGVSLSEELMMKASRNGDSLKI